MNERPTPSVPALALGFMTVGLTSVGGAAAPLRHVLVNQRGWMTEGELAELFGLGQALPGANAVNVAVMFGDRSAGPLGALAAVIGLCVPSFVIAVVLAMLATQFAASNVRFAAAEAGVTAAVAGMFVANGGRLIRLLWRDAKPASRNVSRGGRLAVATLGVVLVAGLHWWIPFAVPVLVGTSILVERAVRARDAAERA